MKSKQLFYIKERHNPQLGVYYIACGQMSKNDAKKQAAAIYGDNVMLSFTSEESYNAKIESLKAAGERVR